MRTLDIPRYASVRPLLNDLMPFNLNIAAVLTGINPGTVYVDDTDRPHVVLMISAEGIYVGGDAPSPDRVSVLKKHVVDLMENHGVEAMWLICSPAWQSVVDDFLIRPPFRIDRLHYVCTAVSFDWRAHVPEGFAVHCIVRRCLPAPI